MNHFQDLFNLRFDVVLLFPEGAFKKFFYREPHKVCGDDLARGRNRRILRHGDAARLRRERSRNHLEDGRFPGAVLAHEGDLGSFTHGKVRFPEDRPAVVLERNFIESQNDVVAGHIISRTLFY